MKVNVKIDGERDGAIIEKLNNVPDAGEYIKVLIHNDIEKSKFRKATDTLESIGYGITSVYFDNSYNKIAVLDSIERRMIVTETLDGDVTVKEQKQRKYNWNKKN